MSTKPSGSCYLFRGPWWPMSSVTCLKWRQNIVLVCDAWTLLFGRRTSVDTTWHRYGYEIRGGHGKFQLDTARCGNCWTSLLLRPLLRRVLFLFRKEDKGCCSWAGLFFCFNFWAFILSIVVEAYLRPKSFIFLIGSLKALLVGFIYLFWIL